MKKIFTREINMLEGPIFKNLVIFAIPIMISNVFQQFYNTADAAIVAHTLGTQAFAAVGSVTSVYDLLVGFALGIGNGLAIVTARSFGSGDHELLKKSVAASLIIGLVSSLIMSVVAMIALKPLLVAIKVDAAMMPQAYAYISCIIICLIVMFAYNLAAGLLRAIGNSFMPLVFLVFSSLLNIGLDLLCIQVLHMGVRGAAVATVLSQGISVVLCVVYIMKETRILVPAKSHFMFDGALYQELIGQGYSMAMMTAIVNAGSVILQSGINGIDAGSGYIIAGHTAARRLYMFFNMPFVAMAQAVATFVSQNKGARQLRRIRTCMKQAYIYNALVTVLICLILWSNAPALVRLIADSDHPVILKNGALYLRFVAPNYFVLGVLLDSRFALQGLGMKILPLISSVIECVGKIVFVAYFIPRYAYLAVIVCEPAIWIIMTIQLLVTLWTNEEIKQAKFERL